MNAKIRELMRRASEKREMVMDADESGNSDRVKELRAETREVEKELRDALAADDGNPDDDASDGKVTGDPEARERAEIRSRSTIGGYIGAVLRGEPIQGAEAELAAAHGCPGMMPLEILEPATGRPETRAVTAAPATVSAGTQSPIPYVFERTVVARLGAMFPMVPTGQKHYPVLTTPPPAGPKAKDAAAASTAAVFGLASRVPKRITGQFFVRREDLATMPGMEDSLRGAISDACSDSLDDQALTGPGTGANLNGLFKIATDAAAGGAVETFATGVSRFAGLVDGQYAEGMADIRAAVGVNTFAHYASLFETNGGADGSLFDYLQMKLGALIVTKRVPAVASMAQKGIAVRQRGSQILEIPTWQGISLIRDELTKAAEGQVVVTAFMLVGDPHAPYTTDTVVEVHPKLS